MNIPSLTEYQRLNPNELLILLDDSGRILDAAYSPRAFNNALDDIYYLMKNGGSVYSTFNIPDKQKLNELKIEYQNKQEAFNFEGAQEEFHTILPLAMIRLVSLGENEILGIIRLSNFFNKISPILHRQPILCVGSDGSVLGYNKAFLVCYSSMDNSKSSLLNKDIKDLMSPTPDEIQKKETDGFVMPDFSKWQIIHRIDCKNRVQESSHSYICFPDSINVDMVDLKVRIEINSPSPLPSLMLGENGYVRPEYTPDANGYMVGPVKDYTAIQLKKQGETVFAGDNENVKDFVGVCEYIKVGRTFIVTLNGKTVFIEFQKQRLTQELLRTIDGYQAAGKPTVWNVFSHFVALSTI